MGSPSSSGCHWRGTDPPPESIARFTRPSPVLRHRFSGPQAHSGNAESNADSSSEVADPLNPQPLTVPSVAVSK